MNIFFSTNNVYRFSVLHSEEDYENKKLFQVICILSKKKEKNAEYAGVCECVLVSIYMCVCETQEKCVKLIIIHSQGIYLFE